MTLDDLNIDDQFTLPGSKVVYCVDDLVDFIDEDSGKQVPLIQVHKVNKKSPNNQTEYMSFDTVIIKKQ